MLCLLLSLLLTSTRLPNLDKVLIKANADFKDRPLWGLEHSLKMPNCEWCSLEVSHSTVIQDTRSQHFGPKKNTSIVMTLTLFVLHCHLGLRLPTFKMVSSCKPEKCARSCEWERRPLRGLNATSGGRSGRWPSACCSRGSPLPGMQGWLTSRDDTRVIGTHKHSSSWGPSCGSVFPVGGGGGSPTQTLSRQGPRRALADRGLWLVTHPGKPKALWWSQNIFGLSTNYRYYGSTFLSWNLKPKALSC